MLDHDDHEPNDTTVDPTQPTALLYIGHANPTQNIIFVEATTAEEMKRAKDADQRQT